MASDIYSAEENLWLLHSDINWKLGYINRSGDWAIEPVFDQAHNFQGERAAAKFRGKWGVVAKNGSWTEAPEEVVFVGVKKGGSIAARTGRKWGFIDETGHWLLKPQFDDIDAFSNGIYIVKQAGMYGGIDASYNYCIEPRFEQLGYFSNGLGLAKLPGGEFGYLDKKGDWVIEPKFQTARGFQEEPTIAAVGQFGKGNQRVGYIDTGGRWIFERNLHRTGWFHDGLAGSQRGEPGDDYCLEGERWGFHNLAGEWVIEPRFESVRHFSEGIAPVEYDSLFGFIDTVGNWLLEPTLDVAWSVYHGLIPAGADRKYGFLDKNFKWVIPPIYGEANDDGELIKVKLHKEEGYIDRAGEIVRFVDRLPI